MLRQPLPDGLNCLWSLNHQQPHGAELLPPPVYRPERGGSSWTMPLAQGRSLQSHETTQVLLLDGSSSVLETLFPRRAGRCCWLSGNLLGLACSPHATSG